MAFCDEKYEVAAERRFDGDFVLFVAADNVGDDAAHQPRQAGVLFGVAHQLADGEFIPFELLFDVAVKALAVFEGGNAGIAREQRLARLFQCLRQLLQPPLSLGARLPLAGDVLVQLRLPVFAVGKRLLRRGEVSLGLFGGGGDFADALFHRLFAGGEGADVAADLGKVLDGIDDAALRLVGKFFVLRRLLGKFRHLALERGDLAAGIGRLGIVALS